MNRGLLAGASTFHPHTSKATGTITPNTPAATFMQFFIISRFYG